MTTCDATFGYRCAVYKTVKNHRDRTTALCALIGKVSPCVCNSTVHCHVYTWLVVLERSCSLSDYIALQWSNAINILVLDSIECVDAILVVGTPAEHKLTWEDCLLHCLTGCKNLINLSLALTVYISNDAATAITHKSCQWINLLTLALGNLIAQLHELWKHLGNLLVCICLPELQV